MELVTINTTGKGPDVIVYHLDNMAGPHELYLLMKQKIYQVFNNNVLDNINFEHVVNTADILYKADPGCVVEFIKARETIKLLVEHLLLEVISVDGRVYLRLTEKGKTDLASIQSQ